MASRVFRTVDHSCMFTGEECRGGNCPAFEEKDRGVTMYCDFYYVGVCLMVPSKNSTGTQEKRKEKK